MNVKFGMIYVHRDTDPAEFNARLGVSSHFSSVLYSQNQGKCTLDNIWVTGYFLCVSMEFKTVLYFWFSLGQYIPLFQYCHKVKGSI